MTEAEIRELEQQLACPSGPKGLEVGNTMHESNIAMTLNTIDFLEIEDNNAVLELGHGNCGHLEKIMGSANGVSYYGLEISETMWQAAQDNSFKEQATFKLYDGVNIPFNANCFDRIMSVNTIYFWSEPEKLLNEIARTLKQDGCFVLTYAEKDFMKTLPAVGQKFNLYDKHDIEALVKTSNLKIIDVKGKSEEVESKTGEQVNRIYTMVKMTQEG